MRLVYLVALFISLGTPSASIAQKRINVSYNQNVEILNALSVQTSADWLKDTLTNAWFMENSVLMRRSYRHFQHAQQHPFFNTYKRLADKIGTGVYLFSFYYTDVPNAQRKVSVSDVLLREVHPNRDSAQYLVDRFMGQLNQFYKDVNFDKFLADNAYVYQTATAEVAQNLPDVSFIPVLETYYGARKHSYNIVINSFFKTD